MTQPRVLYAVVCGAGPAADVEKLVSAALADGWDVFVIATPAGLEFVDVAALESQTGHPVRSTYRNHDQPRRRMPPADAVVVAPATYNTINKLATGVADNYALGLLAECIGHGVPVVVLPFINNALAGRAPLQAAVGMLRAEGVRVLLGPGEFDPHPSGEGEPRIALFPWTQALSEAAARVAQPYGGHP